MGYIGFHASIAGGFHKAIEEAVLKNAEAIQMFTANQRMWETRPAAEEAVKKFFEKKKKIRIKTVISHASYLINLAAVNPGLLEKSRRAFEKEIKRSCELGLDGIVFHPGSHTGGTLEQGIKNLADSVNILMKNFSTRSPFLLFETVSGAGKQIGGRFGDIARVMAKVRKKSKCGVCFDTAHVFEAGYDIKNDYEGVFREFDRVIGLEKIKAFHVNDSKTPRNSKSDRHEHIGKGKIGIGFFKKLMKDKRFKSVPMLIETPGGKNMDEINIKFLKKMRSAGVVPLK